MRGLGYYAYLPTETLGGVAEAIYYPIIFGPSLEIFPDIKGTASSVIMSMRALIIAATVAVAGYLYNGEVLNLALVMFSMTAFCLGLTLYFLKAGYCKRQNKKTREKGVPRVYKTI